MGISDVRDRLLIIKGKGCRGIVDGPVGGG
jgi:hypothetical protein